MNLFSQRHSRLLAFIAVLAVVTGGIVYWAVDRGEAYQFKGGEISPPAVAPPLELTDQYGKPFSLSQKTGKVALIYFGYTTCPDLCPTTLNDFAIVKDEIGENADQVDFVLVTFDPERDTQERMQEYLGFFDPDFIGLRGTDSQTQQTLQDYGVTIERVEYPNSSTGYLIDHTALVYVIDNKGRLRLTYPYGTDPLLMAEDVRYLIEE